jgi:hypothetical protein
MLCFAGAARLGRWQKAKKCRLRLLFQSQSEAQDQKRVERGRKEIRARRSRLDAGPNSPQARRASSTFQPRQAAEQEQACNTLAFQCGRDLMHWLKSTIAASFGMISVEAAS